MREGIIVPFFILVKVVALVDVYSIMAAAIA
jgi:hypothetical protein